MKNKFLTLTISAILGTTAVYWLMKLESFIHRTNNPEYADMVNELAELAIPDLGLVLMFFFVIYPYQFAVLTLQRQLVRRGFSSFRTSLNGIWSLNSSLFYRIYNHLQKSVFGNIRYNSNIWLRNPNIRSLLPNESFN